MIRLAVTAIALLCLAAPAVAQVRSDDQIAESQRRLEEIRRERARLRAEMSSIQSRVHDLSSELENLDRQVDASAELLDELQFQLVEREKEIRDNTRALLQTQDRLAERRALVSRRLRDIYKRGPLHAAQALLTSRDFSDLINRYRYLLLVTRRDRALFRQVGELEAQLTARERVLRRSLGEMERVRTDRSSELTELNALRLAQQRSLSGAQATQRTTAERIEQLAADERRLASLIETMERRRREAEAAASARAPAAPTLTTSDMGSLAWPVEGRLIYRFGRATQPNGTVIRWNGLGIAAAAGAPVRAVEAGTVVLAGPFEGYGPTVVVSHGGGYYSLYLYLSEVRVREGAMVTREETIGTVGGAATPEGAHIEFQIRGPGGQAIDPAPWLRGGG